LNCANINTFFSCSFKKEDLEINDYFRAICEGLELDTKNVSEGYSETPPEVARTFISNSLLVIAILTPRSKNSDGTWAISDAVHQEISIAFALNKPTLLIVEENIKIDGFANNFGTKLIFNRDNLFKLEFLKKAIKSIHSLRMKAMDTNNLLHSDATGYYANSINMLIELTKEGEDAIWKYSTSRELVFTKNFNGQIKNIAWADALPPGATELIEYNINPHLSDGDISINVSELVNTPSKLELVMSFDNMIKKDETLKIDFEYMSKYFSLITKKDEVEYDSHIIEDKLFDALDGMIPIQPTKIMHIQFRFPSWYKLQKNSLFPFVASYSGGIDYLTPTELERCNIDITEFGGNLLVDLKIENPLMRHVYGLAWNLESQ